MSDMGRSQINNLTDSIKSFTDGRLMDIFSAAGDSAITISLIYLLRRSLNDHGMPGMKCGSIANRIIAFTMGTGLLTSLCAIMAVVMVCSREAEITRNHKSQDPS